MYRVHTIFISDIVAGDNLLRNGFVPVFRQGGSADHGVLFAANGTCKTTLLSFLLSVFCPAQKRFVQHLQSGGDKSLEQYLIAGRPALAMLDLVLDTKQQSLFGAENGEHLVLGQLLYRHKTMQDKIERHFFIARSGEFFEEIRCKWDDLLESEQPYRAVRDFMSPDLVQQTRSQKEWADILERMGLDPWLIDRQIDFARTEGGIKDAFKFPSEAEFLSFFLGCVTDLDAAATLRARIDQDLRKMQERPRKREQLKAVRDLKEHIADFDTVASTWRMAEKATNEWRLQLGEATHILQKVEQEAGKEVTGLDRLLESTKAEREENLKKLGTVTSNILLVQQCQVNRDLAEQEMKLQQGREKLVEVVSEGFAVRAAGIMADIRTKSAEADTKAEALSLAGKELTPLQQKVDRIAAGYHYRLDMDRQSTEQALEKSRKEVVKTEKLKENVTLQRDESTSWLISLQETLKQLSRRIGEANARRIGLAVEPGEEVEGAQVRLATEHKGIQGRLAELEEEIQDIDGTMEAATNSLLEAREKDARLESNHTLAAEKVRKEAADRTHLSANPHIISVAGTDSVDLTSAGLTARLDKALSRRKIQLDEQNRTRHELEHGLDELERTETLAADEQTQRLLAYYHGEGISAGELKSYPDYLTSLYDDPGRIARFIEADPGRFTGIMAVNDSVLTKVMEIPVPGWLHRPVVISTPCSEDQLYTVEHVVIAPVSADVYSRAHLEKVKEELRQKLAKIAEQIEESTLLVRGMEQSSRNLHDYRNLYPDRAAIEAIVGQVDTIAAERRKLQGRREEIEEKRERLRQKKGEREERYRKVGDEAARSEETLRQVQSWLEDYADLASWLEEAKACELECRDMESSIAECTDTLEELKESGYRLKADISGLNNQLAYLDERAGELLKPAGIVLNASEEEEFSAIDLPTLRNLHEAAKEDLRRISSELGVDSLHRELEVLKQKIAGRQAELDRFQREHSYNTDTANKWMERSLRQREERRNVLKEEEKELTERTIRLEKGLEYKGEELGKLTARLEKRKADGFPPDLTEEATCDRDTDALLHQLQSEEGRSKADRDRLDERAQELAERLKTLQQWYHEIEIILAGNKHFEPLWDERSPRHRWPELAAEGDAFTRMSVIEGFRKELQKTTASEKKDRAAMESARGEMTSAFERFQDDIRGQKYRTAIPALIDVLRGHDADSLAAQAEQQLDKCDEIAANIETDLELTQRFMDSLVDMLLQHSREYYQKLQAAGREELPADVFIYGGKPILRTGTRLDFTKHQELFRQSVENWLYELMQQERVPEANPRAGNRLGAELLYQLLGSASGKQTFGIRLLKCDDTGSKYEPVGKDLGSGGEALTIAVLLYALLTSMRKKRRGSSDGRIPAFLVLDNPLGVCNKPDFLDTQLKVASGMGLQCVYLTGINDRESLDLFELRVAICKDDKQLEIDGTIYNLLNVTELNVEKEHG